MFRDLPPCTLGPAALRSLGAADGPLAMPRASVGPARDNEAIPIGFAVLARLVEHDASYAAVAVEHGRRGTAPRLALDCVYGDGPAAAPCFYDGPRLLMGTARNPAADLARNRKGAALIPDPRNGADRLLAQLHLAFVKFHNVVVDDLAASGVPPDRLFTRAARQVRWHYQWLLLHEFLPLLIGHDHADRLCRQGPAFPRRDDDPGPPAEFAVAAGRFHLSQFGDDLKLNATASHRPFDRRHEGAGAIAPDARADWRYFFEMPRAGRPQPSRRLGGHLCARLLGDAGPAVETLLTGDACRLPSGQAVAAAIGATPLTNRDLGFADLPGPAAGGTPLWPYILKEAGMTRDGARLGPVGAAIVGDAIVDLIRRDPASYLNQEPRWQPAYGIMGSCRIADLLVASDYYTPPDLA